MYHAREAKRKRPNPGKRPAAPAPPVEKAPARGAPANAVVALDAQLQTAPKAPLPHLAELETLFAADLSDIGRATGMYDALLAAGASAAAGPGVVAFADASPSLGLVAHEVAHALQHRGDHGSGDAEAEARAARDHVERGRPGPFQIGASAAAPVQLDVGGAPEIQTVRPARIESPFAAVIDAERKTAVPGTTSRTLTLTSPGLVSGTEQSTLTLERPVLQFQLVTAYAVPLEDTFPTPEAAAAAREEEKRKHPLNLPLQPPRGPAPPPAAKGPPPKPPAQPPPVATKPPPAATKPPPAAPAPVPTQPPPISTAAPTSASTPASDVVYDLAGEPIKLVARAQGWGVTDQFTKLAVGAASCGVLVDEIGISILDAGVRHTGEYVDPVMIEYAVTRTKELVVTKTGARAAVDNLRFSHTHLDHSGIFDRLSKELVIKKVTINTVQARDPKFQEVLKRFGTNQLEAYRKMKADEIRDVMRKEWEEKSESKIEQEPAAREKAFERYLNAKVEEALKDFKPDPLKVEIHVPAGTGGETIKIEAPDIDIVPREAVPTAEGTFVAKDAYGQAILDLTFGKQAKEGPAVTPTEVKDQLETNYVLKLGGKNLLAVIPDMRGGDIAKNGKAIVAAVEQLGGRAVLLEIGHHFQPGFLEAGHGFKGTPDPVTGLVTGSELGRLSETLTKIARMSKGTYAIASGELEKIDPAVYKFLDLCGVVAVPVTAHDVQFVTAITAKGERIEGFTAGEAVKVESGALLVRAEATLELRREQIATADRAQAREADQIKLDGEAELDELQEQRKSIAEQHDILKGKLAAKQYEGKTFRERQAEVTRMKKRLGEIDKQIKDHPKEVAKRIKEGPAAVEAQRIRDQYNDLIRAKEALLRRVQKASADKETIELTKLDEFARVEKLVDKSFDNLKQEGGLPRITETSMILLGHNVKRTAANAELLDAWRATADARAAAEAPDAPLEAQIEYAKRLQQLRDIVKAKPDIADQKAVEHELQFIDEQIESSGKILTERAKTLGKTTTDFDPRTGATVETTLLSEQTAQEAAERSKLVVETDKPTAPPGQEEAKEEGPPKEEPAKAAEPAPGPAAAAAPAKPTAYQKFDTGTRWVADKVGKGMGAVMIFQNIKAGADLLERFSEGKANLPETGLGLLKSGYGVSIGFRMLKGTHVGGVEFVILSAMEVGQALLGDYSSTAEFDTEVTYALISAGLNAALMYIGGALMGFGPFGIIIGFIIMALGEPILNALGVKAWLAKMFDPRPNEMIDLDRDLQKQLEEYAFTIGSAELKAESDPMLQAYGANDPKAVRAALDKELASRRYELVRQERVLVDSFDAAYKRAKLGYMGFKWLDDQRARFTSLFLKAHENDTIPEAGEIASIEQKWMGGYDIKFVLSKQQVLERLQGTEKLISLADVTEDDVRGMEQWSKLDKRIAELVDLLYHKEYNPEQWDLIGGQRVVDWMKVWEAVSLIEQMISNARYRLDPAQQSTHRLTPLLPEGPAKKLYEQLVLQYENKIEVLRERVLDMSGGTGAPSGVKVAGISAPAMPMAGLVSFYVKPPVYYEPDYGDVTKPATEQAALSHLDVVINAYVNFVMVRASEVEVELPDNITISQLHSDLDAIRKYEKALREDDGLKSYIFNLQAVRAATVGTLEHAHRLFDASATARPRLDKADKQFREADRERTSEQGFYLPEELPALKERVGMTHATEAAVLLGEKPDAPQMSGMEHVAATDEELQDLHLSTIRDRAIKAGIVLPTDPDVPIRRVFALRDRHDVIVAIAPDTEVQLVPRTGSFYEAYDVLALNDAAVKYFVRDTWRRQFPLYKLVPITLNNLMGKTPIVDAPLRDEPPPAFILPRAG